MKKIPILILAFAVFLITDCAAAKPAKNVAAGSVMYTNAPREVAFNASCEALEKLGYKIETKDADKFFVKGSYANPWAGHTPLYAQIEVSQDASATKIIYGVDQPGAIRLLDITGRYSRCANNIRREIEKILAQEDIAYRKNKAKQVRELAKEGSD
jgi:hypothetical protein